MSKIPCDVIKDLLPLYEDNVCNQKSKDMVEEHLTECEGCREYYEAMSNDIPLIEDLTELDAVDEQKIFFKRIYRKITTRQIFTVGIVLLIFLFIQFIFDFNNPNVGFTIVSPKDVSVKEIYRLEDGNIYINLHSDRKITNMALYSPAPMEGFESSLPVEYETYLQSSWFSELYYNEFRTKESAFILPIEDGYIVRNPNEPPGDALYYNGNYERSVIWKKGQVLSPAPESIEQLVKANRESYEQQKPVPEKGYIDVSAYYPEIFE